jgi:hypothetical protein
MPVPLGTIVPTSVQSGRDECGEREVFVASWLSCSQGDELCRENEPDSSRRGGTACYRTPRYSADHSRATRERRRRHRRRQSACGGSWSRHPQSRRQRRRRRDCRPGDAGSRRAAKLGSRRRWLPHALRGGDRQDHHAGRPGGRAGHGDIDDVPRWRWQAVALRRRRRQRTRDRRAG